MQTLEDWAARWQIPQAALVDLVDGVTVKNTEGRTGASEARVQAELQLEASRVGARLWRNNSGACQDKNGREVRYGLGNISKRVCDKMKSSDLIGIEPILIGPEHVGQIIGRFVAVEVKKPGWKPTGKGRELAQANFIRIVNGLGGRALFSTGELF